jgi:hypothetical protein
LLLEDAGFTNVGVYARGNAVTVACYKAMALVLPLLMPQGRRGVAAWAGRLVGLFCLPLLALLAVVAHVSLGGRGGNDCLGYTAVATRQTSHGGQRSEQGNSDDTSEARTPQDLPVFEKTA